MKARKVVEMKRRILLSENEPTEYTDGTVLIVWREDDGVYYCFAGYYRGLAYETDDVGPFETFADAIIHAVREYDNYRKESGR